MTATGKVRRFVWLALNGGVLLVWAGFSAFWAFGVAFFADYQLAEVRPKWQQPIYPVRADAPQWEHGSQPPFYDVFRSAAQEQFRPIFVRISYSGVDDWNYQIDHSKDRQWEFPDGTTLYLTPDLSDEDRQYFLTAFGEQMSERVAAYNAGKLELWATALLPPFVVLGLLIAIRWLFLLLRQGPRDSGPAATA